MTNYVQQRIRNLGVNRSGNAAVLMVIGFFLIAIGLNLAIWGWKESEGTDEIMYTLLFFALFILLGGLLVRSAVKRLQNSKRIESDPAFFIKPFGLKKDVPTVINELNDAHVQQKLLFQNARIAISEHYILSDENRKLALGDLSSALFAYYVKEITIMNNRQYPTWQHLIFFDTGDTERYAPFITIVSETLEESQYIQTLLVQADITITVDKQLKKDAFNNWRQFRTEYLQGRTAG